MQLLFLPLAFIWICTTMTTYLCLLEAVVARVVPGFDESRVPHLLRSAYFWGLVAVGCFVGGGVFITIDFLFVQHAFPVSLDQWKEFTEVAYHMGPYGAVPILPTALCWLWWKYSYGASDPAGFDQS
jgi:hypothetical protein